MVKTARTKPASAFYVALIAIVVGGAGILYVMATRAKTATQPTKVDPAMLAGTKAEGYLLGSPDAQDVATARGHELRRADLLPVVMAVGHRHHLRVSTKGCFPWCNGCEFE